VGTGTIEPLAALTAAFPFFRDETLVGQMASAVLFFGLAVIVARMAMRKVQ